MGAPLDRSATWPYEDGEPGRFSYARADHPTGVACEEALGLWRGEALAGLPGEWAQRTRESLEQHRLATLADWALTAVARGRHAEECGDERDHTDRPSGWGEAGTFPA